MTVEEIKALLFQSTNEIITSKQTLNSFLTTATQLYKHGASTQILVWKQNPTSKFVASEPIWQKLGGTINDSVLPIYSLKREGLELVPEMLYAEDAVSISAAALKPFEKDWDNASKKTICKAYDKLHFSSALSEACMRSLLTAASSSIPPLKWEYCYAALHEMLKLKCGIIENIDISDDVFQSFQLSGAAFPKVFQWINEVHRQTYTELLAKAELEKGRAENGGRNEIRHVLEDGVGLPGEQRAGRTRRPFVGEQLTFTDVIVGRGASFYSAPAGTKHSASEKKGAGRKTGNQPLGSHSDTQGYTPASAGANEPAVAGNSAGLGGGNEGQTTAVLPEQQPVQQLIEPVETTFSQDGNKLELTETEDAPEIYGGAKTKYKNNISAIQVLQQLRQEGRAATGEEVSIMQKYTGWGGIPQAFDERKADWQKEYQELQSLLSAEEYKQARRTTLNAHYTPAPVIRSIYKGLSLMGYEGGRLLDPSTGNGRFLREIPSNWKSELYGIELDALSGSLAQNSYPQANIQIAGYQDALFPDSFFDAIVSNIPFGNYSVADPKYKKNNWSIHEYFFGKSLDKVRVGGFIVFITSRYVLDAKDSSFRKYLAKRAKLLAAVRLPSKTFTGIANTEVTTDILFLQRKEYEENLENGWLQIGITEDNVPVNEYYLEHPQNCLGKMVFDASMYGDENATSCYSEDGIEQIYATLDKTMGYLFTEKIYKPNEKEQLIAVEKTIPAIPSVKNYTYTLLNGELFYRDNDVLERQDDITGKQLERIKGMHTIRENLVKVINLDSIASSEPQREEARNVLSKSYDAYVKKYGYLNSLQNRRAMKEDVDLPLIQSLELVVAKDEYRKADILSKRTIYPIPAPVITTAGDALAASLNKYGEVELEYMASIYDKGQEEIINELGERIYFNPTKNRYETAEVYLSGNVRAKLLEVQRVLDTNPELKRNEIALQAALPKRLNISDISFSLASPWIQKDFKEQFIYEFLKVPNFAKEDIVINYDEHTTRYYITGKGVGRSYCHVAARERFGTGRRDAFTILEDCLNLQVSSVYDTVEDGDKKKRVLNGEETQIARSKQALIESEFISWISNKKEICEKIETVYNNRFNVYVPLKYNGDFISIHGMSKEIALRPHQKDAVARIVFGGNTLLAHEVGSGKTYTMAAAAMLKKQTGLTNKAGFVVPNHMIAQWTKEFYTIFPAANLLVTTKKDFEKTNRQRFISRIATGNFDAVIMTYTQFERIPMSPEYRSALIEQEIEELSAAMSMSDQNYSVKQMEKQKANLEAKLENLADESRKDNTLYFDQLGIDMLFVDEAHYYKNCYIYTKITNVAGLGGTRAEKSFDMLLKGKYLTEKTEATGLVFATGTPITNSLSEMYVMQRYLQQKQLMESGVNTFDEWAGTFANIESVLEIAPEGTGFRDRTRFSTFNNLPELITMFHQVADIQLVEDLGIKRPSIIGGKPEVVVVEPSEFVKGYILELAERAEKVRNGQVDPSKDNMLLITSSGRNVAIDPRLVEPSLPVEKDSKIYAACNNIVKVYHRYAEEKALQLGFLDVGLQLYPIMKNELVEQGIPAQEIAFIHEADSDTKKAALFEKCRNGDIRVLFGSTAKMGAGTNIQDRMIALHDIDCPWRPADLEQRHGRILRQGNQFEEVHIFQYITKGTFDSYLFQTIEHKQKFISQVMTNKSPARSCADLDETVLSYSEIKALAAGDTRIREKMELDNSVKKLMLERRSHYSQIDRLKEIVEKTPAKIERLEQRVVGITKDTEVYKKPEDFSIKLMERQYDKRPDAAEALESIVLSSGFKEDFRIGEYGGLSLFLSKGGYGVQLYAKGEEKYRLEYGVSSLGNITKIENLGNHLATSLENASYDVSVLKRDFADAQEGVHQVFPHEEKLKELTEQKAALDFEIECSMKPPKEQELEYDD